MLVQASPKGRVWINAKDSERASNIARAPVQDHIVKAWCVGNPDLSIHTETRTHVRGMPPPPLFKRMYPLLDHARQAKAIDEPARIQHGMRTSWNRWVHRASHHSKAGAGKQRATNDAHKACGTMATRK